MEETVLQQLLAETEKALDADDWNAVERIWQPWIEQGDPDAEYHLACTYLQRTTHEDPLTEQRMEALLHSAAKKDQPDAICFWATRQEFLQRFTTGECEHHLLRAAELGSLNAQGLLGSLYATGNDGWSKDLLKAAHWYRRAAERGDAGSQYELGFMLLLGEGEPKNTKEGLVWLERSGEQGFGSACGLLADCYEKGYCDVPVDTRRSRSSWQSKA